ncbi:MAG: hypothetical protein EA396_12355 [Anaerolineaceae bacterium]|nr:MAG: hypothetical protein EA396_12355 [Anaerolineaceae bacterium]
MFTMKPKPSIDDFIRSCTPLAVLPELEREIQSRVDAITSALIAHHDVDDPIENLANFLQADRNFLGVILALTNLSQEKFLRILSASRFATGDYGTEWGPSRIYTKLQNEPDFARQVARLFIEGQKNPLLARHVAAFYLKQLALPDDWSDIIRDKNLVQGAVRQKLQGEYNVKKGGMIEQIIREQLDNLTTTYNVSHTKGQVRLVGGKEVDHVLPTLDDPHIMIMSSYMETTSSSQTARANEQREMYLRVQGENQRYGGQRIFINFVDGAGWLARRSDLRKLHASCDYILNLNTLDQLRGIICRYMPDQYITNRPSVDEV